MTTTSERVSGPTTRPATKRVSQSVFDGSRLRVVLLVDVHDGMQPEFLKAYEHLCGEVAKVPGHVSDQICQSIDNPSQWLITSEWESAPPFLAWVNSEEHVQMVRPMNTCIRDTRSMRFHIMRETGVGVPAASEDRRLRNAPRIGDGVIRHAITFTVKPDSVPKVAKILANYAAPEARVDDTTRLCRTSLFMHGNRVVRAIEVEGDLLAALRHVARQPQVRAVEEAINPYLEQERDFEDPEAARMFFARAALPAVHHVTAGQEYPDAERHALYYPARPGCGMKLARLLSEHDEAQAENPAGPICGSTIFQRDDIVVRLIDVRGGLAADPVRSLGLRDPEQAAELAALVDTAAGPDASALDSGDLKGFLEFARMDLVTDRHASTA
ncbi:antibiotic biosynthesis monooxygenase [Streptomyces sp. RY43-2]|uniref:Antibiotic biosynthesis monooxygenase n=1 Tax=Streptomyces macrolidinus TaxID=2952607 RepID=A0ABT0ZKA1_9ACTN|nr:SchA/CurD-like domain-containing protein [Streptomyces macrolidinus]MCN9244017.1 antibiotic biosynthesis monooxygenase [Streptomyces macrolidinus]